MRGADCFEYSHTGVCGRATVTQLTSNSSDDVSFRCDDVIIREARFAESMFMFQYKNQSKFKMSFYVVAVEKH